MPFIIKLKPQINLLGSILIPFYIQFLCGRPEKVFPVVKNIFYSNSTSPPPFRFHQTRRGPTILFSFSLCKYLNDYENRMGGL